MDKINILIGSISPKLDRDSRKNLEKLITEELNQNHIDQIFQVLKEDELRRITKIIVNGNKLSLQFDGGITWGN